MDLEKLLVDIVSAIVDTPDEVKVVRNENGNNIVANTQYADVYAGVSSAGSAVKNLAKVISKQTVTVNFNGELNNATAHTAESISII